MYNTAYSLSALILLSLTSLPWHANACGAWDIGCELRETIERPQEKIEAIPGKIENQWDASRTDLSNGLNRIDPRITDFGRELDRRRLSFQSEVFSGPALEQWIIQSRNDAINGAMPMPPHVRQALQGWYSPQLMDIVRYKVGDGGALNLGNVSVRYGTAEAITLIDVIIFSNPDLANDFALWVHEMKHVQQYAEWGVHSFAVQYMRSWNGVEDPAYAVQSQFAAAWNGGVQPNTQASQALTNLCVVGPGPWDRCMIAMPQQVRTNCSCVRVDGMVFHGMTSQ
jgi:hypothetical protein